LNAIALTRPDSAAEPAQDAGFRVDIIDSAAALEALRKEWQALEETSGAAAVFQSHAHLSVWVRHFVPPRYARLKLHIAVVRRESRAVLILPLVIGGTPLLRIARMAGDPVAQYSEALADPASDARGAFDAAIGSVRAAGVDAIVLRRVRDDSLLLRLAGPLAWPPTAQRAAPFVDLWSFESYDAYLLSLSRKTRHALRNRRRKLDAADDVGFELMAGGPAARQAVADAMDLKRKWLVRRGEVSTAFADPATRECLLELAAEPATGSRVATLTVNGDVAAIRFGFEYRGTHFTYLSAYDDAHAKLAPGRMLLDFVLSGFKERGLQRVDMLPPAGRHKREWCGAEMGVADYTVPLTEAGRIYAEVYQERLRPGLQSAWGRMPASLRTLLAALLLRL
jgi:CelD/BcsL family acetyltransferase involved in cellulose biosynthesis